jgi:phospholipid/cholesterol/gamma-HCH transport system substrate-binding protein
MRRRDEVSVGILLTVAVIIAVAGSIWLLRGGLKSGYSLYTRFPWGQNLKQGQPVLLAGVSVGYVSDVKLRNEGYLDVDMKINQEYRIPRNSTATVKSIGIFGDVAVALTPTGPSPQSYNPGDTIPSKPGTGGIEELTAQLDSISRTMSRITKTLEVEFVQAGALRDLRRTAAAAATFSTQLQSIAAEQNRNLTATLNAYRRAATAIDSMAIDSTLKNIRSTSENFARLATSLDTTSSKLSSVIAKLDRGEGSAGKLLTDTLLYRNMRNLLGTVDSLMADFKKNPRKYINLSIF